MSSSVFIDEVVTNTIYLAMTLSTDAILMQSSVQFALTLE